MKNGKTIGAFVFLVLVIASMSVMAGCITSDEDKIEGTIHNTITDEKCWIYVYHRSTGGLVDHESVAQNSTEVWELAPGAYRVKAMDSHEHDIAYTDFTIDPTDTTFTIVVYSDDVTASSS